MAGAATQGRTTTRTIQPRPSVDPVQWANTFIANRGAEFTTLREPNAAAFTAIEAEYHVTLSDLEKVRLGMEIAAVWQVRQVTPAPRSMKDLHRMLDQAFGTETPFPAGGALESGTHGRAVLAASHEGR